MTDIRDHHLILYHGLRHDHVLVRLGLLEFDFDVGERPLPDCPKPRDEARIRANREAFRRRQSQTQGGRGGPVRGRGGGRGRGRGGGRW